MAIAPGVGRWPGHDRQHLFSREQGPAQRETPKRMTEVRRGCRRPTCRKFHSMRTLFPPNFVRRKSNSDQMLVLTTDVDAPFWCVDAVAPGWRRFRSLAAQNSGNLSFKT